MGQAKSRLRGSEGSTREGGQKSKGVCGEKRAKNKRRRDLATKIIGSRQPAFLPKGQPATEPDQHDVPIQREILR